MDQCFGVSLSVGVFSEPVPPAAVWHVPLAILYLWWHCKAEL